MDVFEKFSAKFVANLNTSTTYKLFLSSKTEIINKIVNCLLDRIKLTSVKFFKDTTPTSIASDTEYDINIIIYDAPAKRRVITNLKEAIHARAMLYPPLEQSYLLIDASSCEEIKLELFKYTLDKDSQNEDVVNYTYLENSFAV